MTSPQKPVSPPSGLHKFFLGFRYAANGVAYALRTQCNIRVQLVIAVVALVLAILLNMPLTHMVIVIITMTVVLTAELLNTAIEALVDLASPEYHDLAKTAKDVAAGAVLVSAIGAAIIGTLLFGNALLALL